MSRVGVGDAQKATPAPRGLWTRENVGYCTFLLLKNPDQAEKHANQLVAAKEDRHRVERKTKRKLHATKEYINQNRRELWVYLYHRELRREAMELSLEKSGITRDQRAVVRAQHFDKESQYLRLRRVRTSLNEFTILARLGKGGYGQVYLCRKVDTGEVLALKQMKKSRFTDRNEVHRVKKEREVMTKTDSIWLARLKYCFQSQHYLYMAMEYIPGGDLKTLLDHMTCLDEMDAKFLFAEMALAVDALHQLGYIHRDLKPDNFMIDRNGHLKLIDFGLSKEGFSEKLNTSRSLKRRTSSFRVGTWSKNNTSIMPQFPKSRNKKRQIFSVVGSPEYMALEILNQEGYSNLVDYWSLGVILFEFLFGYTPFGADTVAGVFENVKNYKIRVCKPPRDEEDDEDDDEISDDCWDLITKLITSGEQRIGKNGINDLKNHRWFRGFDWGGIREMEPPFMPNLESENDTSYFPTDGPMVQSGLAELEAENDDLDHLISKQLARSSESNSMESVFDHRSGKPKSKTSQAFSITAPTPASDSVVTHQQSVITIHAGGGAPGATSSTTVAPKPEKGGSGSGRSSRRGSQRRSETPNSGTPTPGSNGSQQTGAAATADSILAAHAASPSPPPPLEPGEHPKLKFNQSYSKFDFAGFTFKHEDFSVLESGSPRGEEGRERSNSTVDLEHLPPLDEGAPAFVQALTPRGGSGAASITGVNTSSAGGSGTNSRQLSPGSSPATMDSLLSGSGTRSTATSTKEDPTTAFSAPTSTASAFSAANNAPGTPSGSGINLINKRNLMGSVSSTGSSDGGKVPRGTSAASGLGTSSPASSPGGKTSKHRPAASLTGAPRSGSVGLGHSHHDDDEPSDSVSRLGMLGRTATVQVIDTTKHRSSSASAGSTTSDAVRHADSTPLARKNAKIDDIDSLKRRLTKLKKQNDEGDDSSGNSSPSVGHAHSHSTGSPGLNDSRSSLYSSDPGIHDDSLTDSTSTIKKKKSKMRKLTGSLLGFIGGSKDKGSDSGKESGSPAPGSPHIVVSGKASSTTSPVNLSPNLQQSAGGRLVSPRERDKPIVMTSVNAPAKTSTPPPTSTTPTPVSSTATTGTVSSPETPAKEIRTRAGTMGDEAPPTLQDSPEFVSIRNSGSHSRHRSEGRGHSRSKTSSRDGGDPTNASSPQGEPRTPSKTKKRSSSRAGSITSEGPPTPETSKRSSSKRSSAKRDSSRRKRRPSTGEEGDSPGDGPSDPQSRKERLLALARQYQESQANATANAIGSLQLSGVDRTGSHSAASSSKSSPRNASGSPLRGGGRSGDRDSNKGDKSDRSDRSDRSGVPANYPPLHERLTPTLSQITDDSYSSGEEDGARYSSSAASTAPPSTGSNASRSKRGSERRSKRDDPGTPRKRVIDPVEEASNEATPNSTPFATPDRPLPSAYSTPGASDDQDSPLSAANKKRSKTAPILHTVASLTRGDDSDAGSSTVRVKKPKEAKDGAKESGSKEFSVETPKVRSPRDDQPKTPRRTKEKDSDAGEEDKDDENGKKTGDVPRRKSTPRYAADITVDSPARRKASKDGNDKVIDKDKKRIGRRKSDAPSPDSTSPPPPAVGSSTRKVALTLRTGDIPRGIMEDDTPSPAPTSARKREKLSKEAKLMAKESSASPREGGRERSNSSASKSPRP